MRRDRISIIFGGMILFVYVVFIQLLTLSAETLDVPLTVAIYVFSFVLPMSAFYALSAQEHLKKSGRTEVPKMYDVMAIFVVLLGLVGITALFGHFGKIPAAIFLVASLIALGVFNALNDNKQYYFSSKIDNAQKRQKKRNPVV